MSLAQKIINIALDCGAQNTGQVNPSEFPCRKEFRDICEQNSCGRFGTCYNCPPACGPLDDLIKRIRSYSNAVVISIVSSLEDPFDFEGMTKASKQHDIFNMQLCNRLAKLDIPFFLLGSGGCSLCDVCAITTGEPCRHPNEIAVPLEACGVDVSALAAQAGMKYINGPNTVTYFSAILF